jgi:hypothetical protein
MDRIRRRMDLSLSLRIRLMAKRIVDELKQRGADCIKVYDRLPRDVYFAIVEEAKAKALPIVGHVPLAITSEEASNAGQQSIEHLGKHL